MEANYRFLETELHFEGRLGLAYLNRPERFNSFNTEVLTELRDWVAACGRDEKIRCLAISGRGKAFCSGQDLKEVLALGAMEEDRSVEGFVKTYYNPLVLEITKCAKPVIALVNGAAVGAGAMLSLICDFSLAAKTAYFSQAFVNIGLIPDTAGTYYLPKLIGRQRASYLAFTGKRVSAEEAVAMGLVAEVFSDETFMEDALKVLEALCHQPTRAIALTKRAFASSYCFTLEEQLDLEGVLQQKAAETQDFKEGVSAFLEKRKPKYKGL